MSLITRQLPALYNGVSQQPATLRLPSQCEAQVNALGSVVDGVGKRPPFQHIARITTDDLSSGYVHTINRDTSERYVVIVTSGKIQVFDALTGSEKTVNVADREFETIVGGDAVANGTGVLCQSDEGASLLSMDVITTGISGDTVIVERASDSAFTSPTTVATITTNTTTALTNLEQGEYYRARISVDGAGTDIDVNLRWKDTSYLISSAPATGYSLVSIADYSFVLNKSKTVAAKVAAVTEPTNFVYQYDPEVWAYSSTGYSNDNYFWNPQGTINAGGLTGTVQTFSDLPDTGGASPPSPNDLYKVAGYDQDNFGSYYVSFVGGVWEETFGPNMNTGLDEYTMPHALVRESDGTFTLTTFKWKTRQFGDDDSNPDPTFVGRALNDVFYYKNRLGFVADENVVFSGVNDFGNFYRSTVVDLLDSDVIDVAVSSQKVSLLKFAVPFAGGLMLFSDQTQFSLNVDTLLTPTSASIDTVTEYAVNPNVRPFGIGSDVYFASNVGEYSAVREYFVRDDAGNNTDATNITAHVPRYVPKNLTRVAGSSNADILFSISSETDEDHRIYVYKLFWNGDEKAQSSWSYWELDDNDLITSIDTIDQDLFALIKRADGMYLEKLDLESGAVTGSLSFDILLDRRAAPTSLVWNSSVTTVTIPYPLATAQEKAAYRLVRTDTPGTYAGTLYDPDDYTWTSSTTFTVPTDISGNTYVGGLAYEMRYTFSQQFAVNGENAITTGRLMLRTFTVYFTESAFFETEVDPYGAGYNQVEEIIPSQLTAFTGKTIGSADLITGVPIYQTGTYAFQIHGDSKQAVISLTNDMHVQSKFQQVEWEGFYHNRARPA